MATATLTSLLVDILLNPGVPTTFGTGNAPASETSIHLEGTSAGATGHAGALGPVSPTTINGFCGAYSTVTSFSGASRHLHIYLRVLYPIRNKSVGGVCLYLGDATNQGLWYATGLDQGYSGDYFHYVLNIDATDGPNSNLNSGTEPSMTALVRIGVGGNISATKGEDFTTNHFFDAIRRTDANGNNGIRILGGTTGDRLVLADIAVGDATLKTGILRDQAGAIFCDGELHFGNAASTMYFEESLNTVIFSNLPVSSTYYGIYLNDGTTGITSLTTTDFTWKGVSRAIPFVFDASAITTGDELVSLRTTYLFASTITFSAFCSSSNDSFIECVTIVPSGIALINSTFSNCDVATLTAINDAITGGTTNSHNTLINVPFITTNSLSKISGHSFDNTGGVGHAIEITTIGTYTFSANFFTGYGADASSSAAIYNNSGGLVTINITNGGDTPTIRNGTLASTTLNNSVTLTITVLDSSGSPINLAQTAIYLSADDTQVMNVDTNASGIATISRNYVSDESIYIRVRKSSTGTRYLNSSSTGTITVAGLNVTVTLREDNIVT